MPDELELAPLGRFGLIPCAFLRRFDRQCERQFDVACARGVAYPVHALEVSFETFRSGARVFADRRPRARGEIVPF